MRNILKSVIILSCCYYPLGQLLAQGGFDRPTFFRDGQRLMEQEIQRLQQQSSPNNIEHPSQLLTIDREQIRWQKIVFRDGNFSVWMPQGIQSSETVIISLGENNLSFEVVATHPQNYRFVAAYSDNLNPEQLYDSEQLLNQVKEGIIKETNFTLLKDESLTWQQYRGKKLTMQDEDELISFRVYLISSKVYVLAARQNHNNQNTSKNIVSFFESFRVL
ncbi:hypothetical protein [Crocosphaera sp.]|uniref:hypothetical protein n=1 Tax=Crocosphaera sp. TaxID=2729996 RepID=UPI003F2467D0|nr:hypothetical protein [Crocosphaera sp.]